MCNAFPATTHVIDIYDTSTLRSAGSEKIEAENYIGTMNWKRIISRNLRVGDPLAGGPFRIPPERLVNMKPEQEYRKGPRL